MSNIKEANSRHSFVAAQQALTPRARDIKNALSKTARAKAATKKYARRISTISPDYSKQDVIDQLKSMGEETRLPPKFYAKIVAKLNKKKAGVKEDVQQIAEVGDTPKGKAALASYVKKAAPQIRSNTTLKRDFEDEKYRHLKTALKHSPNVDPHKTHERDPEKRANAEYLSKGASDLSDRFGLKAKNRIKGIQRAATRLAKEEVEQIDEVGVMKKVRRAIAGWGAFDKDKPKDVVKNTKSMSSDALSRIATAKKDSFSLKNSPAALQQKVAKHELEKRSVSEKVEQVDEVLKPSMGASAYISDFVHSKNPKFAGKSKAERTKMALGAYYGAKKAMKEGLDPVGKEDADVNNDGKHGHSTDKYLLKRRAAISKAIASKKG